MISRRDFVKHSSAVSATIYSASLLGFNILHQGIVEGIFDADNLYAGACWSQSGVGKTTWKDDTGFVTILEGDKVVSNPGGTEPTYIEGTLTKSYQLSDKPIFHGHDVCIDEDKNLYVCQWNANKTPPLKLERI